MGRVVFAASLALVFATSALAKAEIDWTLSEDRRVIALSSGDLPLSAHLRPEGALVALPLDIERTNTSEVLLKSDWPLMPSVSYEVELMTAAGDRTFMVHGVMFEPAQVLRVSPLDQIVPENLLRLNVQFTAPMARGRALQHVRLVDADGEPVDHAFLNLGVELWSSDHQWLTLLFEPGRLKRGVGPNRALGAPLVAGRRYAIEVGQETRDAYGRPISERFRQWFAVGPAERRAIDPSLWTLTWRPGTLDIAFDRVMDEQSVQRALWVQDAQGRVARPTSTNRSDRVTFALHDLNESGELRLVLGARLEDAAGNTSCAPFDAALGQGEVCVVNTDMIIRPAGR